MIFGNFGEPLKVIQLRLLSVSVQPAGVGNTVQRTGLYPSGTPFVLPCDYRSNATNAMTPATDRLHIGNHWLGQSGLNYYDNTARLHDPILCDFKSGDPQYIKYPSMSHYSFCGANFANSIDPTGENVLHINQEGYVIKYEIKKGEDKIAIVDGNDNVIDGTCMTFLNGSIILERKEYKVGEYKVDIYTINGEQNSKRVFEYMTCFTSVEWGLLQGSDSKGNYIGVLSTSHDNGAHIGSSYILKNVKTVDFENDIHNHPNSISKPSGLYIDNKHGDIETFKKMDELAGKKLNHYIYTNSDFGAKYTPINPYQAKYHPYVFQINNIINSFM
ncbi:MAG: hypothetical protein K2O00_05280 [Muribaculaceae bacterium]|nr:hypothetical protein [Muribaculaceae bacterium]